MTHKDDNNRKYSSLLVDGIQKAPARSMLRAVGFEDKDFQRPQVGIASTWGQNDEINLAISDEEMQKRLRAWQAPEPNVKRGVLAKYAKTVGSASEGAITDKF